MAFLSETGVARLWQHIIARLNTKVEAESGKGLSTNDYTTAEKEKLAGIADSANNYSLPSAGTSLGGVKSGGDVTIASGIITVNDSSHNHTIGNITDLQTTLNNKAATGHSHSNATESVSGFMSTTDKATVDGLAPITTTGDGVEYIATVPGITALDVGVSFTMVPHVVSAAVIPTLNVNNLGAKQIRRRLSSLPTSQQQGYSASWLGASKPTRVVYDGTYWIAEGLTKPAATDLYGQVAIANGGTGASTASAALTNLGAAASDHTHTASEVGAASSSHTHTVSDISGTLPLTNGGTGATSAAAAAQNIIMRGTSTNLNTATDLGIYIIGSMTSNSPVTYGNCFTMYRGTNSDVRQIVIESAGKVYTRSNCNGTWLDWRRMVDETCFSYSSGTLTITI